MHDYCHRCGAELPAGDAWAAFCAHCGAPQLVLSDYSEPLSTGSASTGTMPPPLPNPIDWQMAIRCALIVAGVAAALSLISSRFELLKPISSIWTVCASLTTLGLYQRRRPLAQMNAKIGARIGVLVGVIVGAALSTAGAIGMLVARLWLHSMSEFDIEFASGMKAQIAQLSATSPIPADTLGFLQSAEFRTTMMLLGILMALGFLLVLSAFGGAMAGLMRSRQRKAA